MHQKQYVILFRSIFSLFVGFMSFAYIALMKVSGLESFQIGLILTLSMIVQLVSYIILIFFSIVRNIVITTILEILIGFFLLFFRNIYGFLLIAIIMGISNSIFSSVIIIQKDFIRKDYSTLMALTAILNIVGIGLFYLSSFENINIILSALILVLILNAIISFKIKYEEPKESLKDFYRNLKSIGKIIFPVKFFSTLRRTLITSYIPLILLSVFLTYSSQKISLYLALFQIPLFVFLYIGYKISNKLFLITSIIEFIMFLILSLFYSVSIFIFLSLILLANATAYLRAPASEEIMMRLLRFNTKLSALSQLIDVMFSSLASTFLAFLIKLDLYYVIFIVVGLASFSLNIIIYKLISYDKTK
ncbi:hypothetical protein [Acidianus brierleyi]|uniref:hypothetical protein n=1 Tax=Acidianus brierleyi TaxID=41673 RepID=UPI001FEC252F|nr:hypothetical protein [Acidianus brierleyi]